MTPYQVEGVISSIVNFIRWLLKGDFSPERVTFAHKISHEFDEYQRVLGCPVCFGAEKNTIALNREQLRLPIPQADPDLCKFHQVAADELLVKLKHEKRYALALKKWLEDQTGLNQVTLSDAAGFLNLSPRTLQRKLKKEAISYQELHHAVIMEKAHHLLCHSDKSISEITEELGYTNNSSFFRGFKRFYKKSPSEYRQHSSIQT